MNPEVSRTIDWKKYAAITVSVSAALFALWILMKYGVHVLLPFLLSWVLSLLIAPLAEALSRVTRIPKKLCAVLLLLLSLALLVGVIIFSLNRLFREIEGLFRFWTSDPEHLGKIIQQMVEYISEIGDKIPFLSALDGVEGLETIVGDMGTLVSDFVKNTVSEVTSRIPTLVGRAIAGTPSALLFLLVFLISSFYFCVDGDRIASGVHAFLPRAIARRTVGLRRRLSSLLYRYLRVYFLLFLLTFTELLIGFMLLGRNYAFLLALLISALDILPVFGVGSVLLPWAGVLFLVRDFQGAIGLLILWGIITVVRQIVEPRLIGESLGMHPLVALVSLYAGLKLFGFIGILVGPAVAVFLKLAASEVRGVRGSEANTRE